MVPFSHRFWTTLHTLASSPRNTARRTRKSLGAQVPTLESRALLAGVANATFSAGTLTITGVDDLTTAAVTGGTNNQNVTLTGGGAGIVTVAGVATTVNGAGTFTGVTAIKIDLKLGNDIATLTNIAITGGLTYLGGDGDNQLTLNGGGNHSYGSITVTNGDGFDSFEMLGTGDLTVTGALTINQGEGDDTNDIGSSSSDVKLGSLKYAAADGNNELRMESATLEITGTTQVSMGEGSADIRINPTTSLVLGGSVTITTGNEGSEIQLGGSGTVSGKAITITNGNGESDTRIRGAYAGAISITNGNGFDSVKFDALSVTGNITVKNGSGGSDLDFANVIQIQGGLSITNGNGNDEIGNNSASWVAMAVSGSVTINNGNGDSRTKLSPSAEINVGSSISVTCANGNDETFFEPNGNLTVGGGVTISTGTGDSDASIAGNGNSAIAGSVNITNGDGDTEVLLFANNAKTLDVAGSTTITTGAGSHRTRIVNGNTANGTVRLKTVSINNGVGDSETDIAGFGGTTTFDGAFTLKSGAGLHGFFVSVPLTTKTATVNLPGISNTDLAVDLNVRDPWTVNGDLLVTTNNGDDSIDFSSVMQVSGKTTISTGTGDDIVDFISAGSTLTGSVSITLGAGQDDINFQRLTVVGNLSILSGTQNDNLQIDGSTFRGTVAITMGAGNDDLLIEQLNNGLKSRFEKSVTINGEGGDDEVTIGLANDVNDFAEFLGSLTLNGGNGIDIAKFKNAGLGGNRFNTFFSAPIISLFEQQL